MKNYVQPGNTITLTAPYAVTRAYIQTPKLESGRVLLPKSAPWLSELEAELLAFPSGRHDDQVDSIVHALAYEFPEKGPDVIWL